MLDCRWSCFIAGWVVPSRRRRRRVVARLGSWGGREREARGEWHVGCGGEPGGPAPAESNAMLPAAVACPPQMPHVRGTVLSLDR